MSRLAVSNIAWSPDEDDVIAELLRREGIGAVEIAPTKWRERPLEASGEEIAAYRRAWEARGLSIVSLQSLLFGRPDLQLFGTDASRTAMLDYLRGIVDLAAALGAGALVFGSPKNRVRGSRSIYEARQIAYDFFQTIGEHAGSNGTNVCIEANPPEYGCDFITTTAQAVELCGIIDHPAIRVNVDLGGMTISGESIATELAAASPFLGHFHASEPQLAELGSSSDHGAAGRALAAIDYRGWVSIEMRAAVEGENASAVERAIHIAKEAYDRRL